MQIKIKFRVAKKKVSADLLIFSSDHIVIFSSAHLLICSFAHHQLQHHQQQQHQTWYLSLTSLTRLVEKKLPCGEFSAFHVWRLQGNQKFLYLWRNFRCLPMTDVEKSEIVHIWHVCDVENVAISAKFILFSWKISFVKIYALCRKIHFVVIYALLCGEKFI